MGSIKTKHMTVRLLVSNCIQTGQLATNVRFLLVRRFWIYVTSFTVFHTVETVSIGLKNVLRSFVYYLRSMYTLLGSWRSC